jgi:NTE family protein
VSHGLGHRLGVVISGGAPTLHLAAGALCAFHEAKVHFDVVATSGAGALPGLLYLAPKHGDPEAALRGVLNMNIHDAIYHLIPNNYKVFFKYGPFSPLFYRLGQMIPHFPPDELSTSPLKRLANDWIDFVTAAVTPTTLTYWSKSVLNRVQVINDLVDWKKLAASPKHFFLNAFKLDSQELEVFRKDSMTPDAFYAALAMPWLYPPTPRTPTSAPLYTEGASHDPSGIEAALENTLPELNKMDSIIVLDTISADLWTDPESIQEALELAIMDPIVTLAENVAALYALQDRVFNDPSPQYPKIYRLPFEIPQWQLGKVLEWSYSNAVTLWNVGYRAAQKFSGDMKTSGGLPDANRYFETLWKDSREGDFLGLFGDPFAALGQVVVPPPVRSGPGGGP